MSRLDPDLDVSKSVMLELFQYTERGALAGASNPLEKLSADEGWS